MDEILGPRSRVSVGEARLFLRAVMEAGPQSVIEDGSVLAKVCDIALEAMAKRPHIRKLSQGEIASITEEIFNVGPEAALFDNVPSDMTWGELVEQVASLTLSRVGGVAGGPE